MSDEPPDPKPQEIASAAPLLPELEPGCFLMLPVGDGTYRRCNRPFGHTRVFCREHE